MITWWMRRKSRWKRSSRARGYPSGRADAADGPKAGRITGRSSSEAMEIAAPQIRQQIEQQKTSLEQGKWYVNDREDLTEYSGYGENADRMRAIGRAFPVYSF